MIKTNDEYKAIFTELIAATKKAVVQVEALKDAKGDLKLESVNQGMSSNDFKARVQKMKTKIAKEYNEALSRAIPKAEKALEDVRTLDGNVLDALQKKYGMLELTKDEVKKLVRGRCDYTMLRWLSTQKYGGQYARLLNDYMETLEKDLFGIITSSSEIVARANDEKGELLIARFDDATEARGQEVAEAYNVILETAEYRSGYKANSGHIFIVK